MLKRFIKNNKTLVGVICTSLVLILVLLVFLTIKYSEMLDANADVNNMRSTIADLLDSRKNRVAAIEGNLDRLKADLEFYTEKNHEIEYFFGHPYALALDEMAKVLDYKDGRELGQKFHDFIAENKNETVYYRYQRFKLNHRDKWDAAIAAFQKEAQKISFEEINGTNIDDIFLQAIEIPRQMSGLTTDYCKNVLDEMTKKMFRTLADKEITIGQNASTFTLNSIGVNTAEQTGKSMFNMEIVGDMVHRLANASPHVVRLENFTYKGEGENPEDKRQKSVRYQLEIIGTLDSLRAVLKSFNESYKDRRIYVLNNIALKVAPELDEAAHILGLNEPNKTAVVDNRGTSDKKDEPKVILRDESDLPYNERSMYGDVLLGNNRTFIFILDFTYIYLPNYK